MKTIFTITGMPAKVSLDNRSFGFYFDLDEAIDSVKRNRGDIHEDMFEYVVVEEYPEGVFSIPVNEYWFRFNRSLEIYIECERPEFLTYIKCFGFH